MARSRLFERMLTAACALGAALLSSSQAHASPPGNDDFNTATVVYATPYTDTLANAGEATTSADDPAQCAPSAGSVWYSFTASESATLEANSRGSTYDTVLSVYTGARGALRPVGCNDDAYGLQSRVTFDAVAGQTYFIEVAQFGAAPPPGAPPAQLVFNLTAPEPPAPPPANDAVSGATRFTSLPFTVTQETTTATAAVDDPLSCYYAQQNTVWFSYTPTANVDVVADTYGSNYFAVVSAYTGTPSALSLVACGDSSLGRLSLTAGRTYYFEVGAPYGLPYGAPAMLTFNVNVALGVTVSLDASGLVVPSTGATQVRGSITCTRSAFAMSSGSVRQRSGRGYIEATLNAATMCGPTPTPLVFTFTGRNGAYAGGPADVALSTFAYGTLGRDAATASTLSTVNLRGTAPKNLTLVTPPPPPPRP